jgi:cytidine deaminase
MIKTLSISFSYKEFESVDELNPDERELIFAAREAALLAYAPYSKFRVGAAIRLDSGIIVCGSNVENAAFPSGICAERNAVSTSVSNYINDKPLAIAIAAVTDDGKLTDPVPPCGNCRQVIAEEELRTGNQIKIILSGRNKTQVIDSISSLLPLQFNKKNLEIKHPL